MPPRVQTERPAVCSVDILSGENKLFGVLRLRNQERGLRMESQFPNPFTDPLSASQKDGSFDLEEAIYDQMRMLLRKYWRDMLAVTSVMLAVFLGASMFKDAATVFLITQDVKLALLSFPAHFGSPGISIAFFSAFSIAGIFIHYGAAILMMIYIFAMLQNIGGKMLTFRTCVNTFFYVTMGFTIAWSVITIILDALMISHCQPELAKGIDGACAQDTVGILYILIAIEILYVIAVIIVNLVITVRFCQVNWKEFLVGGDKVVVRAGFRKARAFNNDIWAVIQDGVNNATKTEDDRKKLMKIYSDIFLTPRIEGSVKQPLLSEQTEPLGSPPTSSIELVETAETEVPVEQEGTTVRVTQW